MPGAELLITAFLALLVLAAGWLLVRWAVGDRARGRRRCPNCWYDLAGGASDACPECGAKLDGKRLDRTRRGRWRPVVVVLLLLTAGGLRWGHGIYANGWDAVPGWMIAETARLDPKSGQFAEDASKELRHRLTGRQLSLAQHRTAVEHILKRVSTAADPLARLERLEELESIEYRLSNTGLPGDNEPPFPRFRFGATLTDHGRATLRTLASDPDPDVSALAWKLLAAASRVPEHADLIPVLYGYIADNFSSRKDLLARLAGTWKSRATLGGAVPFATTWLDPEVWTGGGTPILLIQGPGVQGSPGDEAAFASALIKIADAWEAGGADAARPVLDRMRARAENPSEAEDLPIARMAFWTLVRLTHDTPGCRAMVFETAAQAVESGAPRVLHEGGGKEVPPDYPSNAAGRLSDLAIAALGYYPDAPMTTRIMQRALCEGKTSHAFNTMLVAKSLPDDRLAELGDALLQVSYHGMGERGTTSSEAITLTLRAGVDPADYVRTLTRWQHESPNISTYAQCVRQIGIADEDAAEILWDAYINKRDSMEAVLRGPANGSRAAALRSSRYPMYFRQAEQYLGAYAVASANPARATREALGSLMCPLPTRAEITGSPHPLPGLRAPSLRGLPRVLADLLSTGSLDHAVLDEQGLRSGDPARRFWALHTLTYDHETDAALDAARTMTADPDPVVAALADRIVQERGP